MRTGCNALLLVLSLLTGLSHATTWYVDAASEEFRQTGTSLYPWKDIQPAIDHAGDGDTIIVAPGRYISLDPWAYGELNFKGKSIRLVSSAPTDFSVAEKTILCGAVIFRGDEDPNCLLQGFKIQNHTCGGILGNDTEASVSHCIISGNGPCGATVVKDMRGELRNCLIVDNTTFHGCAVQPVVSGCKFIFNCTIANNISSVGIEDFTSSTPTRIHNCIVYGNQGGQLIPFVPASAFPLDGAVGFFSDMRYSLVQGLTDSYAYRSWSATNFDSDPCFVLPGHWEGTVLVEGDYHLKSEGYRWSEQEIHGSHWYYDDSSTSRAIDAGDPLFGLGEELERAPDDPEGLWGVNHAMDCGAYGGTTQASLAPNRDRPLGVAGVDLRDYLPLTGSNSWSTTKNGQTFETLAVTGSVHANGYDVYILQHTSGFSQRSVCCVYVDYTLYTIENAVAFDWLPDTSPMQAKYPQILTVASTIQVPEDPFAQVTAPARPAWVARDTLKQVLAGTKFDPSQFAGEYWDDVIAILEKTAEGTLGEPMAIFGRGFGPMLLGGRPVTEAHVGDTTFIVGYSDPRGSKMPMKIR
jgi:hypothetical protein